MITNYLKNGIQNYIFRGVPFEIPSSYYLALSKTEPLPDGTGTTEPSGGNYERVEIGRNAETFSESKNGNVSNLNKLGFNESTESWGSIPYYCVFDSKVGGNLLFGGNLSRVRNIEAETQLFIHAGSLSFVLGE